MCVCVCVPCICRDDSYKPINFFKLCCLFDKQKQTAASLHHFAGKCQGVCVSVCVCMCMCAVLCCVNESQGRVEQNSWKIKENQAENDLTDSLML